MAFFKKDRKPTYLSDVEPLDKGYKEIDEALIGELNNGSLDSKETTLHFDDRKVVILSVAGVIKSAFEDGEVVSLGPRLYWAEQQGFTDEEIKAFSETKASDLINTYAVMPDSDNKNKLGEILKDYMYSTLTKASQDMSASVKVRTEIVTSRDLISALESLTLCSEVPQSIGEITTRLSNIENATLSTIGISSFKEDEVTLFTDATELPESLAPFSDEDRFVFGAAQNDSSLADIRKHSFGFKWSDILLSIRKLSQEVVIDVAFPGSNDALPALIDFTVSDNSDALEGVVADADYREIENPFEDDEELEDKGIRLDVTERPFEGVIVDRVNDSVDDYAFGSSAEDEGNFIYEMLNSEEAVIATAGLDDKIDRDVRSILKMNAMPQRLKDEINSYLERNADLENRLETIEKSIADNHGKYHANVGDFEELRLQKAVISHSDDSETGREDMGAVDTISAKQDVSHIAFFTVSKLEEDRYIVNSERRRLLTKLAAMISELLGESVQDILHRIENKLVGIECVTNIAFHNPKDDENEHVDPTLLYSINHNFTAEDVPTFFALIERLGFSPFDSLETVSEGN